MSNREHSSPMKEILQNTQRIKSQFEYQTASRLYEQNIISTSYRRNKQDIVVINKDSSRAILSRIQLGIKSTNKYCVTYDNNTKNMTTIRKIRQQYGKYDCKKVAVKMSQKMNFATSKMAGLNFRKNAD